MQFRALLSFLLALAAAPVEHVSAGVGQQVDNGGAAPKDYTAKDKPPHHTKAVDHSKWEMQRTSGQTEAAKYGSKTCGDDCEDRKSDLDAQWKAADAAYEGARWAIWQVVIGIAGTMGLVASLVFTVLSLRYAIKGIHAAEVAIAKAGEANVFAAKALDAAGASNIIAADALNVSRSANSIALGEVRMNARPLVIVKSVILDDDWQAAYRRGSPCPLRIILENLGRSARRGELDIVSIQVFDSFEMGDAIAAAVLPLPAIHPARDRLEKALIRPAKPGFDAHYIEIVGEVRAISDDGLECREPFRWVSDPLDRCSGLLVETQVDSPVVEDDGERHEQT